MKAKQMNRSVRTIVRAVAASVCALWLVGACGGATQSTPVMGSESHFLKHCTDSCGDGLDCIGGICTTSCLTGGDTCSALASGAACTNRSVEPGAVAVCDVSCSGVADCGPLGAGYACEGGFCRAPAAGQGPNDDVPDIAAGGASGTGGQGPTGDEGDPDSDGTPAMCEDFRDQTPPPIELPAVTIVNTGTQTVYLQPYWQFCGAQTSLVQVTRLASGDSPETLVNLQGFACHERCADVLDRGWFLTDEGPEFGDCGPGAECVGAPLAVAIEPGQSLVEPGRLPYVPVRLPRECARGITTDTINCSQRVIPGSGPYRVSVRVSTSAECNEPECTPVSTDVTGNWGFEALTLEVAAP